ncbi:MAG: hypothetical protein DMF74_06870 [Acidobacteria bacterium]|nr:MAG: hypothetical protein DMF74_06870 [Acidobacteriota bacterium]
MPDDWRDQVDPYVEGNRQKAESRKQKAGGRRREADGRKRDGTYLWSSINLIFSCFLPSASCLLLFYHPPVNNRAKVKT